MKKILTLMATFALSFVACSESDKQIQNPDAPAPKLTCTSDSVMEFPAEGGRGTIAYTLLNPVKGVEMEAFSVDSWIEEVTVGEHISFTVSANKGEARQGKITVAYQKQNFEVAISQAAYSEPGPEPEPLVLEIEKVSQQNLEITFNITSASASSVKWMMIMASMLDYMTAETILAFEPNEYQIGGIVNPNQTVEVTAMAQQAGMGDWAVVAAATNGTENISAEPLIWTPKEEPEPLVLEIEKVSQQNLEITFNITSAGASSVKWMMIMASMLDYMTAETILAFEPNEYQIGGIVNPNQTVEVTAMAQQAGMGDWAVVAAATNGTENILAEPLIWTPEEEPEPGDETKTTFSKGVYSASGWYSFAVTSGTISFDLLVNAQQSTADTINAGEYMYAPIKNFASSEGFFYVENFLIDEIEDKPQINSSLTVLNDEEGVEITLILNMNSGTTHEITYNGAIGNDN